MLVQEGIYDKFVDAFKHAVESLTVGDGFDTEVTQGPLINEAAVLKVYMCVNSSWLLIIGLFIILLLQ